ncbi:RICIN domain-containing protein [Streptomyces sp. NPDC096339]|uniref:RICIN domain-containing protein n=1 Tax=Streptomyces sp. NPDC096339 TaxID=3366086 RepID=UPI0037F53EAF
MRQLTKKTARVIGTAAATAGLAVTAAVGTASPASAETPDWLMSMNSGKCLVAQGGNDGSSVFQYSCLSYNDQKWAFQSYGNDTYNIMNLNSHKCLVVQGTSNGNGAFQTECDFFADQKWVMVRSEAGFMLANYNSGKCLVVQGTANGSRAFQYTCDSSMPDQWWHY